MLFMGKQVMIVTNETIAPLYLDSMVAMLSVDYHVDTCVLPDGEVFKTLDYLRHDHDSAVGSEAQSHDQP